jgi:hypothetical protein
MSRGAEFGEISPKNQFGRIRTEFGALLSSSFDLDNGVIFPLTPVTGGGADRANSFRLGQQIIFWFGIGNPITSGAGLTDNWVTRLRLKLWWLRPNLNYRAPGAAPGPMDVTAQSGWTPLDRATFGDGPNAGFLNNRYCWMPSPKRMDTTPYMTAPPPLAPVGNSDSILLDDILTWDLQDPTVAAYAAGFSVDQVISRWSVLMYPAMGYALGVTAEPSYNVALGAGVATPSVQVSCSYAVGTLGGTNYQESLG